MLFTPLHILYSIVNYLKMSEEKMKLLNMRKNQMLSLKTMVDDLRG